MKGISSGEDEESKIMEMKAHALELEIKDRGVCSEGDDFLSSVVERWLQLLFPCM